VPEVCPVRNVYTDWLSSNHCSKKHSHGPTHATSCGTWVATGVGAVPSNARLHRCGAPARCNVGDWVRRDAGAR
jgi:hypothetical protein